ncbi:MAG: WbqC family protein [Leeuwenhoekiella sp.]
MKNIRILSNYFGDVLTYAAIAQSERIILEHCDNYQKQTARNRTVIATANGLLKLTVPIKHTTSAIRQKTASVSLENAFTWQRDHWRSLQIAYRTSPYFEYYEDDLKDLFLKEYTNLEALNTDTLKIMLELLQLDQPVQRSTAYHLDFNTEHDFRFLSNFKRKNKTSLLPYRQVFDDKTGFLPHLSILDLLFNLGPESNSYLLKQPIIIN